MSDETDKKLDEILAETRENNKLLRSMVRSARLGRIMSLLYYLVIIAATVGAFYYVQPLAQGFYNEYKSFFPQSFQGFSY
jgi:hypothetical protein